MKGTNFVVLVLAGVSPSHSADAAHSEGHGVGLSASADGGKQLLKMFVANRHVSKSFLPFILAQRTLRVAKKNSF